MCHSLLYPWARKGRTSRSRKEAYLSGKSADCAIWVNWYCTGICNMIPWHYDYQKRTSANRCGASLSLSRKSHPTPIRGSPGVFRRGALRGRGGRALRLHRRQLPRLGPRVSAESRARVLSVDEEEGRICRRERERPDLKEYIVSSFTSVYIKGQTSQT